MDTEVFQAIRMALEAMPPRDGKWFAGPKERYYVTRSGDLWICGGRFFSVAADMAYVLCRAMAKETV